MRASLAICIGLLSLLPPCAQAEFSSSDALDAARRSAPPATPEPKVVAWEGHEDGDPVSADIIKTLPEGVRTSLLNAYARLLQAHYKKGEYVSGKEIVDRVLEIDPQNGHGLYYCGELERASTGGKSNGHKCFELYLSIEQERPELRTGPAIARCYDNGHGYCEQRTGWICHKMANDLYKSGKAAGDAEDLQKAASKVLCALARFPNEADGKRQGFNGEGQGIPTAVLEGLVEAAIAEAAK